MAEDVLQEHRGGTPPATSSQVPEPHNNPALGPKPAQSPETIDIIQNYQEISQGNHGMRGIESAYVSIFIVFIQLFELEYIGELPGGGFFFFFLIHSHLIHSHIDVYMLYFRDCSCIDYDTKWSIIPSVS